MGALERMQFQVVMSKWWGGVGLGTSLSQLHGNFLILVHGPSFEVYIFNFLQNNNKKYIKRF